MSFRVLDRPNLFSGERDGLYAIESKTKEIERIDQHLRLEFRPKPRKEICNRMPTDNEAAYAENQVAKSVVRLPFVIVSRLRPPPKVPKDLLPTLSMPM